jgi:hypothetical protein
MNDPPLKFYGWLSYAGKPWHLVCAAATRDKCWELLMAHCVPLDAVDVRREALREGERPWLRVGVSPSGKLCTQRG